MDCLLLLNIFIFLGVNSMTINTQLSKFEPACIRISVESLGVYRKLLDDVVVSKMCLLLDYLTREKIELGKFTKYYNDFFFTLVCNSKGSLKEYIIESILFDENPYSRNMELHNLCQNESAVVKAVLNDLDSMQMLAEVASKEVKEYAAGKFDSSSFEATIVDRLPEWGSEKIISENNTDQVFLYEIKDKLNKSRCWSEMLSEITEFYKCWGTGIYAKYRAFVWERSGGSGYIKGISNSDTVRLADLIGYEVERSQVVDNTIQFVNGYPANNVLLYGDRGTGKSSTVKALLNEYYEQGLRMIEVPKNHLLDFTDIIRDLKGRPQRFIIFVDDLAFEDNEENYTALKAVLEGGLESKPENVLVYATSNRRHLVKEKFSDRAGLHSGNYDEEVRSADNMQEKLSLADRFGITVVFSAPDKNRYLRIVEGIAAKRGINIESAKLHSEALKWEIWYNGRSPRTARQFVDWLEGEVGK